MMGTVLCNFRMFNSILGLYPLHASSTFPLSPVVTIKNSPTHCKIPSGDQSHLGCELWCRVIDTSSGS